MIRIFLWSLISIVIVDTVISYTFNVPRNNVQPGKLTQYFDYGRSIESKVFRIVGTNEGDAANIAKAGWFKPLNSAVNMLSHDISHQRVFIYGMSFSNHIGQIISQDDPSLDVRLFAGPGAPLNHSYTYYQRHRPHSKGDIIILGILASSIPRVNTMSHMTASFESPAAHFYPRYSIDDNDKLIEKHIAINSLAELRVAMHDETRWREIKKALAEGDSFYNELLFSKGITDKSVYLNLIRRAWGQKHNRDYVQRYHDKNGFKNTEQLINVSQRMVTNFAEQVRSDGAIPFIILFNDRGFNDHLYAMLEPVLSRHAIPYFSTHYDFPADKLSNFIPDGHFTPQVDHLIASSILKKINELITAHDTKDL